MPLPVQYQQLTPRSGGHRSRARASGEQRHLTEEFPLTNDAEQRAPAMRLKLPSTDEHEGRVLHALVKHAGSRRHLSPLKQGERSFEFRIREASKDWVRGHLPRWACLWAALTVGCGGGSHLWTGPLSSLGDPTTYRESADQPSRASSPGPARKPATASPLAGAAIADAARTYLTSAPKGFRNDCSGFVEAVLARAGVGPFRGSTRDFWQMSKQRGFVHHRRRPHVGDLAFFDDTWDRNGNGRLDDELTHLAVVIDVSSDGTVVLAHVSSSRGRTTFHMNLLKPDVTMSGERRLNDHLRRAKEGKPAPTLASELWRGFATLASDGVALVESIGVTQ